MFAPESNTGGFEVDSAVGLGASKEKDSVVLDGGPNNEVVDVVPLSDPADAVDVPNTVEGALDSNAVVVFAPVVDDAPKTDVVAGFSALPNKDFCSEDDPTLLD
jgi:hypothetical protein